MAKVAKSAMINQKALIKADFVRKGMNLKKFRQEVLDELSDSSSDDQQTTQAQNVPENFSKSNWQNIYSGIVYG